MKLNYILLSVAGTALLSLQSCFFSEDDLFDASTDQRIERSKEDYRNWLTASEGGWLLEYYAGEGELKTGGSVMLLRFEGENVTVASDTELQGYDDKQPVRPGQTITSKYALMADQSVTLSFTTYNTLIHYWSEPKGNFDADGLGGDFEFVITSASAEEFVLKGKKHGEVLHMRRNEKDWDSYITACNNIRKANKTYCTFVGKNGETIFAPYAYFQDGVITLRNTSIGTFKGRKVPFAYTDQGIRLYAPTDINGVTCHEFTWNADRKTFTSTENNSVRMQFEYPEDREPIEFYTDNEWDLAYTYNFGRKDTVEHIRFTRIGETDSLRTNIACGGIKPNVYALYNSATGMIEIRTQYLSPVTITTTAGETMNLFMHLCPWNDESSLMLMTEKPGIVSYTTQMEPRRMAFTDNGQSTSTEMNGFVFYAFKGEDRDSERLGVLETYNNLTLTLRK